MGDRRVTRSMKKQLKATEGSVTITSQYQVTLRSTQTRNRATATRTVKATLTHTATAPRIRGFGRMRATRAVVPLGLPTVLPLAIPGAKGFIYASGDTHVRTAMFHLSQSRRLNFDGHDIPHVVVDPAFRIPDDALVYYTFITAAERDFLVYGYHIEDHAVNALVSSLDATLQWRGDVIVFEIGRLRPLLRCPTVRRDVLDNVVVRFVNRVELHR